MLGLGSGINPVRLSCEVCKVEMCFVRSDGFALVITLWGAGNCQCPVHSPNG